MNEKGSSLSARKRALLLWELRNIKSFLDEFENTEGIKRSVVLSPSSEVLLIDNFPLPDNYTPDYINILLDVSEYTALPPIGLYVLNNNNEHMIEQLKKKINAYRDTALHSAAPVAGYTWLCWSYKDNKWRYRDDAPSKGDNVCKFLNSFYAVL
jgi:hypothetical protein